jgi:serine/threonine protein kinase/tetratricopeptide (TPR) repeat protein
LANPEHLGKGDHAVSDQPYLGKDALPPSMVERLDKVCDSFEGAWKTAESTGHQPRIEDYLGTIPESERSALLRELIALDIAYRQRAGERLQTEDYRERFPFLELATNRTREANRDPLCTDPYEQPIRECASLGEFEPGTLLKDRYLLERVLGRGGMGQVYLASDQILHRPVAVKVIWPRDPELRNRTIYEAGLREAFAEEARIGANLTHPAIATVFDFGFHDDEPFIVFEYIQGETLRDLLSRRGRLPLEDVRLILGPLAQALDFAHSHHVVHRDLKPENIRATLQGHFKILDLGLAKEFRHAVDWSFAGTPLYASPEQAERLPCDGRTDQYALALITYEMITGHRVFEHADWNEILQMHRSQEPPSPERFLPGLPETVCAALARALQKEPNQRFPTCEGYAVAMGCQLLSTPVPLSEVLRLTRLRKMSGHWRNTRFRPIRHGTAVYLALAADALWVSYRGEIRRWPLQAITDIQRSWWGAKIYLRMLDGQETVQQSLHYVKRRECGQWYEQLQILKKQLPPGTTEQIELPRAEPVVMMRERPVMRYQSLGTVEFKDITLRRAEVGLQIRAAMIGADAVVDVQQERLPEFRRTVWRRSGMAIRAVDSAGRLELRSRWFATEVSRLSLWMLMVIGSFFIGTLLCGCFSFAPMALGISMPLATGETLSQRTVSVAVVVALGVVLIFSWPLAIVLLVRWLLWPQLLRPAALAVMALGATPLASLMGSIGATAVTGKWQATVFHLPRLLTTLGISIFSWFLCRRAWRAYSEYCSLVPVAEQQLPPLRRAARATTLTTSIIFAVLLWGLAGWGGYGNVSDSDDFPIIERLKEANKRREDQEALPFWLLEDAGEQREGRRLESDGQYPAAAEVYRQALERHEQRMNKFTDQKLLVKKQHRLAKCLVSCPDVQVRKPIQAIELAKKAVAHAPDQGDYWNTLGAAYYRAGDWNESVAALEKCMQLRGDASDWLFLAMACHQLKQPDKAKTWLDKAVDWIEQAEKGQLDNALHRMRWEVNRRELEHLRREAEETIMGKVQ